MFAKLEIEFTKDPRLKKIKENFNFTNVSLYAKDFGGMISNSPLAVFSPPTIEILQEFLFLANKYQVSDMPR